MNSFFFNEIQTLARNPVKCAFWRLKAGWAILTRSMDLLLNIIRTVIYACYIVNNIYDLIRANEEEHENLPHPIFSINADEGATVYNVLISCIYYNYTCLPDHLT